MAGLNWTRTHEKQIWARLILTIWEVSPPVIGQLLERFPKSQPLIKHCQRLIMKQPEIVLYCSLESDRLNHKILELCIDSDRKSLIGLRRFQHQENQQYQSIPKCLCCNTTQYTRITKGKPPTTSILNESYNPSIIVPLSWLYISNTTTIILISLLQRRHRYHVALKNIVITRALDYMSASSIVLLIPQLIQALRFDHGGFLENYISSIVAICPSLGSEFIFQLSSESSVPNCNRDNVRNHIQPIEPNNLPFIAKRLINLIFNESKMFAQLTETEYTNLHHQCKFFDRLISLSGELLILPVPQRQNYLKQELTALELILKKTTVFWPTNPSLKIVHMHVSETKIMQSAAKTPYMLKFDLESCYNIDVERKNYIYQLQTKINKRDYLAQQHNSIVKFESQNQSESSSNILNFKETSTTNFLGSIIQKSMIFKLNDDIRQDQLALQIIRISSYLFNRVNLPLSCKLYHVIPYLSNNINGKYSMGGMIEVVTDAISRHQLGKMFECSLSTYFRQQYIQKIDSNLQSNFTQTPYLMARWEFLRSLAACCVISFLLQVKDRHNGNLLITKEGQILHIDFGYLFDISPGHDLRFEMAPFKLTAEMIELLGGSYDSEEFKLFEQFVVQGYLTLRQDASLFLQLVTIIMESGLQCFKKQSLKNFSNRFQLNKNPEEAAAFMRRQILASYNALSTRLYDVVQSIQQGIAH